MAKPLGMCQVGIKSESIKLKKLCQIMSNYELLYYTILTTKYIYYDFYKRKKILFMVRICAFFVQIHSFNYKCELS
jgi:hypothetical protein